MKAAVLFAAHQPFEVHDVSLDTIGPHEVLVRVAASGLCHSDLHFVNGDLPFEGPCVLGHEAAGIIEAIGSAVTSLKVGDPVVSCVTASCGQCNACVSGRGHVCGTRPRRGSDADPRLRMNGRPLSQTGELGAFAEQMLVHEKAVVRIDPAVPLDRAALLGCGVLTGLGAALNSAKIAAGSKVVVIGCGGVGLNVIQGARISGASQIVAVDLMAEKRELARHFGATDVVAGGPDAVEAVREITGGGADYSFEVIGLPATMTQAVQMLVPGGLMTMVGAMRFDASFTVPGLAALMNEWRIQGSFMGGGPFTREIPRFAAMYLNGALDLDSLVSERIALTDINAGFATMRAATQARSVITFPDVLKQAAAHA